MQWLETEVDYNKLHKDVAWLIYLYLRKHAIFFDISLLRNKSPPACWEGLSLTY